MEQHLLDALAAHAYTRRAPVVIQSFETANLRALRDQLPRDGNIRLLQLIGAPAEAPYDTVNAGAPRTYAQLVTEDLPDIARYADAIGPHYRMLQVTPREDGPGFRSALVDAVHAHGLQVFAYTFRPENAFLDTAYRSDAAPETRNEAGAIRELQAHAAAGVDAVFADDPALARKAVPGSFSFRSETGL
jgi:glycerophosphoryl diester phosphodiesterase